MKNKFCVICVKSYAAEDAAIVHGRERCPVCAARAQERMKAAKHKPCSVKHQDTTTKKEKDRLKTKMGIESILNKIADDKVDDYGL